MNYSKAILMGIAALALVACSKKDTDNVAPETPSSREAANVSASSPLESEFRLSDAEPVDVDQLLALLPEGGRPSYDGAEFDDDLGATVVSNLRFADRDDGEAIVVERAEFYGVDLEAIDRVKTAEDAGPQSPFEVVAQKVRFLNVSAEGFDGSEGRFAIGGVEFDGLSIRQGGFKGDGEGDDGARFFNAVSLSGLYFQDIEVENLSDDAPLIGLNAPDIRLVGLGGGKLDAIIANDLEYNVSQSAQSIAAMSDAMGPQAALVMNSPLRNFIAPENQRVFMESFEWRGIDFSGLLDWGLKGETPPMDAVDLIDLGEITARNLDAFIGERRLSTIEEATVTDANFTWIVPSLIRVETKGVVYDLTAYIPETEEEMVAVLKEYKMDAIKGDGFAQWQWNSNSGAAGLEYTTNTEGFMDFALGLDLSGLKLKDFEKAQESGDQDLIASLGAFNDFSLTLKDENALDAIFAIAALQMGGTADDLRQSAPAMIRLSGMQIAQMSPRLSDYVDAIADFVGRGGTLEISASPEDPVAFSALQGAGMSPQDLPDTLNLTVVHKE